MRGYTDIFTVWVVGCFTPALRRQVNVSYVYNTEEHVVVVFDFADFSRYVDAACLQCRLG